MKNRLSPRFLVSPHARKSQFFTSQNQFHSPSPSPQHAFSQQPDSIPETSCSQPDALDLPFSAKAHDGIARRGGRSPSAARKLPKQKPRSPRGMVEYGKPSGANPWERRGTTSPAGSSGGSAEGASEGRQPLTGPHLPPPEAAQTKKEKSPCTRRVQKSPFNGQAMQRKFRLPAGGGPNYINEKPLCPQGAENTSRRPNSALFALKP